ncbi:hypothetical protein C0995_007604 [Termitomyces sp. Mi166|nr:hypothetical protein C0995_007604 [Termitomyces sp. Mi166\
MAPKISLLNVSPDACLLECKLAAQKFIVAADAVFFKAQGLATLVPLHKMVFGLLEALADSQQVSWEHAISTIEQIKLMHFEKMAIELESSMPTMVPQPIMNPAPTPVSTTSSIQRAPSVPYIANPSSLPMLSAPQNKGKGKAKAMEDDDDDEETAQKLRKELEDFVVLTTCDHCIADNMADHCWYPTGEHPCWRCYRKSKGCLWNGISVRTQKKRPPLATLVMAKRVKLVQAAKAFLERQGKLSQFFVLEEYKGKGKAKALVEDSEPMGTKQSFKLRELVDSDSDEEEEEDRVHVIKKIKREHIEELTGAKRRKEIMESDNKVEIVAAKIPAAGPSHPTSKPIVLVPSTSKFIPKLIVTLASPLAGPSTVPIASSSAPKPVAAAALSKPTPAISAGPAVKGGSIFKDSFMVRHFKLAGTEESGALIINQATEVPATQGTLHSDESGNKDTEGDDDNSDSGNVAMNVDSAKQPEETQPVAPIKTVTEIKAPASALAPALLTKPQRTPFLKLHCTAEHFPYLLLGLQAPIQFKQNRPSVEQWRNQAHGHYEVAHKMLEDARRRFESVCQELQWVTMQHNAMALYLHDCDAVMNWHKMNNIELGEFSDTKDLPVAGGFPVIYPH